MLNVLSHAPATTLLKIPRNATHAAALAAAAANNDDAAAATAAAAVGAYSVTESTQALRGAIGENYAEDEMLDVMVWSVGCDRFARFLLVHDT